MRAVEHTACIADNMSGRADAIFSQSDTTLNSHHSGVVGAKLQALSGVLPL